MMPNYHKTMWSKTVIKSESHLFSVASGVAQWVVLKNTVVSIQTKAVSDKKCNNKIGGMNF